MTDHDPPVDEPLDTTEAAIDQRLTVAIRTARATTRPPEHHTFLAAARTNRNRRRRHRRAWTVATPIAAAVLVVVAIGVIAAGGRSGNQATTSAATRGQATPGVDADTPVRVTPDTGLVDGQTVQVTAYGGAQVMFSQCAVVRTADGTRFYACADDPAEHAWNVTGAVPPGSTDDTLIAQGSYTVHDRLQGRLYLLAYPSRALTGLTAQASDVSCVAGTPPIVDPVPAETGTDTMAPTTTARPLTGDSTEPKSPAGNETVRTGCVVMVSGMFKAIFANPPMAPITFATSGTPDSSTAAEPTCPTKPGTPNTESDIPTFDFTPTALALCAYTVDGERFLDTSAFPEPDRSSVSDTIDLLEGLNSDFSTDTGEPHCAPSETAIDRVGVVATDGNRHATAWMATAWCVPSHMITPYGPDGPP